jgi:general stress protein 26
MILLFPITYTTMTKNEKIDLIAEKIKGLRIAIFITRDEHGHLHGRPMGTHDIDINGDVWFMTSKNSHKIRDIEKNPQIALMYGDCDGFPFVSVSGHALLSNDGEKIKEYWSDFYKAWFENEEDPNIILIKVSIIGAEYWDHKGGQIGAYVDMATAAITGQASDNQENEKIKVV